MNLWEIPVGLLQQEQIDALWTAKGARVERIVSIGHTSPDGFWYDQSEDEWLVLLQGEAVLQFEEGEKRLQAGEILLIPAHQKHRVAFTTADPPCIWLCVFAQGEEGRPEK